VILRKKVELRCSLCFAPHNDTRACVAQ